MSKLLLEPRADLPGIACLRQDPLPDLAVRGVGSVVPALPAGSRKDYGAAGLAECFDHTAKVAETGRDECQDRVHVAESRVRTPLRHAVHHDVDAFREEGAPRRLFGAMDLERRLSRRIDRARRDTRDL